MLDSTRTGQDVREQGKGGGIPGASALSEQTMKTPAAALLLLAVMAGCESSEERVDIRAVRAGFHYHRSFQFQDPNPEMQFELGQMAGSVGQEKEYGYVSTREGRWSQMNEVVSVEYKLDPALEDLSEYLASKDIEVPAREVEQMISAIEMFKPCSVLAALDNSLALADPRFREKYEEYIKTWREFNVTIRNYIKREQAQSFADDVMDFLLRMHFTNYDSLWGMPRRGVPPGGNEEPLFFD